MNQIVSSSKTDLRRKLLDERRVISSVISSENSKFICKAVQNCSVWKVASCVHIYVTGKDNEVDTRSLIAACFREKKRVCVPQLGLSTLISEPRIEVGHHAMAVVEINSFEDLVTKKWGIPQPSLDNTKNFGEWDEIDLVIVPGLAFDKVGTRLGSGYGYYDRFLPKLNAQSVGLCYTDYFFDFLPCTEQDASVDFVATEFFVHTVGESNSTSDRI